MSINLESLEEIDRPLKRGKSWTYVGNDGRYSSSKKKNSRYWLPETIQKEFGLEEFHRICAVRSSKSGKLYICVIPDKGGEYKVVKKNASFPDDIVVLRSEEDIRALLNDEPRQHIVQKLSDIVSYM